MENQRFTDTAGNALEVRGGEVTLDLRGGRSLIIGRVYTDNERKVLLTIRKSDKHLFRKLDAYGFNYVVLTKLGLDFIKLIEDKERIYLIPVSAINEIGKLDKLNFSKQGFELQRFVSRTDLQQFQIQ